MNLCKIFKFVGLLVLIGLPLSIVFTPVISFIVTGIVLLYYMDESTDKVN